MKSHTDSNLTAEGQHGFPVITVIFFLILTVIVATGAYFSGQTNARMEDNSSETRAEIFQIVAAQCNQEKTEDIITCAFDKLAENNANSVQERNVLAQQETASSTSSLVMIGALSLLLSLLGIYLVARTLSASQTAATASRSAAAAAIATNQAFLVSESGLMSVVSASTYENRIKLTCTNTGKTDVLAINAFVLNDDSNLPFAGLTTNRNSRDHCPPRGTKYLNFQFLNGLREFSNVGGETLINETWKIEVIYQTIFGSIKDIWSITFIETNPVTPVIATRIDLETREVTIANASFKSQN
ncbi:MAG: hypothetical protein Pars92KO_10140 [Parasphingorhabdus sp.]